MSDNVAITVEGVTKTFALPEERHHTLKNYIIHPWRSFRSKTSTQVALQGIDFEVEEGEFLGIVGRNGSGKSTLLKILAGIYQPTEGRVRVRGKLVPFIELGVGFNPELTGRENVFLNAALLGFSEKETHAMYQDIVDFAEIEKFMDQKLKNYSSGMQVRLAFSIAIQAQADILLLDEVLAVGDAAFQRKCFDYFRHLKKEKRTVILVSHDMSAIREYCTRAMLVDNSVLVDIGSPESIAKQYNKLFADDRSNTKQKNSQKEKRFGSGELTFSKPKLPKRLTDDDKALDITVSVQVRKAVDNPNFGISIKDAADAYVCGTNTRLLGQSYENLEIGQKITFTWSIPNIFHDGKHYVNMAAVDMSEASQYDWWDEAGSFEVVRNIQTPFIVSPNITLEEHR